MNKYLNILIMSLSFLLTACIEDKSELETHPISDITVETINEDGYRVVSYVGNILKIEPLVETKYAESQLTYTWYIYDNVKDNNINNGYKREKIADGKNLEYEVNLNPGSYTLIFEVKADNGYTVTQKTKLTTTTEFADGFYILKETESGDTDMDIFYKEKNKLNKNILKAVLGEPMKGTPKALSMCYYQPYIDRTTHTVKSSNLVSVSTNDNEFKSFNTVDMSLALDRDNILFDQMKDDEYPNLILSGYVSNYLLTNKGLRAVLASKNANSSGRYGFLLDECDIKYYMFDQMWGNVYYWNERTHSIMKSDTEGACSELDDLQVNTSNLNDYKCVFCGYNANEGVYLILFILENNINHKRYLYTIDDDDNIKSYEIPAGRSLTSSNNITTSFLSAAYIYSLSNNKIYAYDLFEKTEKEIVATGIPSGETITYISDYNFDEDFNYFIIGTQTGNNYKLYFYEIVGGELNGAPVYTTEGTGKIKSVRYTKGGFDPGDAYYQPGFMN